MAKSDLKNSHPFINHICPKCGNPWREWLAPKDRHTRLSVKRTKQRSCPHCARDAKQRANREYRAKVLLNVGQWGDLTVLSCCAETGLAEVVCPKGHRSTRPFGQFSRESRCIACAQGVPPDLVALALAQNAQNKR